MPDGSRSSFAQSSQLGWKRWLLPSVGDVIFLAFLGILVFTPLSTRLLGDAGIGWHIRTGQQILSTHVVPRVDFFSSTMFGKPWFAWEWLFDLAVGWLHYIMGLNGVVLFAGIIIASVFAWTFRMMMRRGANLAMALLLVLLAASASMIHFQARPHLLSWLLTLAWFSALDGSERSPNAAPGRGNRLWLLPFIMLVWVNVHGSWPLGFVLLAIHWISALRTRYKAPSDRLADVLMQVRARGRLSQLTAAIVAVTLATSINPYGWRLHAHVYQYLNDNFLMNHIDEFQSPNFHGVAQRCFAALLLLALTAFAMRIRRVSLQEALLVLFAVFSGLWAARNIPVSSLLLVIVIGPILTEVLIAWCRRTKFVSIWNRMTLVEISLRGHLWPIVAVLAAIWIAFHGGRLNQGALMNAHFDDARFPVQAIDFIARQPDRGPLLTPDYWGGYAIYRLNPSLLVVADDRHDLYGSEFFRSYLEMIHLAPHWDNFLRDHSVHRVLMPAGAPLTNILSETAEWKITYRDNVAVLFER